MFSTLKTLENHLSSKFSLPEVDDRNGLGEQETLGKFSPCLAQPIRLLLRNTLPSQPFLEACHLCGSPPLGSFSNRLGQLPASAYLALEFITVRLHLSERPGLSHSGMQLAGNFPASSHECKRVAGHKIMLNFFFATYILLVLSLSPSAKIQ